MTPAIAVLALALAAPAPATPATPPSAWLERQQTAAADEADAAAAKLAKPDRPKERCRVVKEWKVGETVVQHRICDDAPEPPAGKV
ncbi:hypothetical protein JAK58_03285 [Stenotrophomonas maltophilia]|nr:MULTISPECIES: hypothetical protein [Stenotrophomonas]MBH1593315.1 hypothetical protein [Stenotrophomonas maltophilia]MBH1835186.1 hypothetical protein [Stenotrophomonas maltophilia]MCU1021645.1 hypothetical protein [Stenotrophomonas maltophilia]MCU1090537.1 hypothetical protein [Stenotrophomonas maltophilia]MDH2022362.1 hypothetical protein [Stenotrophomonas sp. GD03680]